MATAHVSPQVSGLAQLHALASVLSCVARRIGLCSNATCAKTDLPQPRNPPCNNSSLIRNDHLMNNDGFTVCLLSHGAMEGWRVWTQWFRDLVALRASLFVIPSSQSLQEAVVQLTSEPATPKVATTSGPKASLFDGILWSSTTNPKLSTKICVSCLGLSESVSLKSHPQIKRWSHPKAQVHKCEDGSFSCRTISSPQWGGGRIMPPALWIFRGLKWTAHTLHMFQDKLCGP